MAYVLLPPPAPAVAPELRQRDHGFRLALADVRQRGPRHDAARRQEGDGAKDPLKGTFAYASEVNPAGAWAAGAWAAGAGGGTTADAGDGGQGSAGRSNNIINEPVRNLF